MDVNLPADTVYFSRIMTAWLAISLAACGTGDNEQNEASLRTILPTQEGHVKAMVLHNTDFNYELISNGTITAVDKVDLYFETSEIVDKIYVRNGQQVRKGQKIAELSRFKLQSALDQAADNLEKSKLELQDVLISQGYALRDSLDVPPETMKIAQIKSNYAQSMLQHNLARHDLEKAVLYAPFDGVVANLFAKEYNKPPTGEPFCTIIGSHALEADFNILESELAFISEGHEVQIAPFSLNDYTIAGKVDQINPIVDENGLVRIKARIHGAPKGLYEGMNIRVRIQQSAGSQLVIPKSALVLRNNRKVVFTAQGGKAMWNYVQTGSENSSGYVITDGLRAGDSVIYEGNLNLAHESPIRLDN